MEKETKFLRMGELFSGPGGLAMGAISAVSESNDYNLRIQHLWANDIDHDSCLTYKKNICKNSASDSVICSDVKYLHIENLKPIDIFAYGFPCNDFSIVGEQKGFDGIFGGLYNYGIKVINHFRPKIIVAENVGGIVSANNGSSFKKILSDLENAGNGYRLTVHLYKSEDYGVPQTRHRYIIVGFDKSTNLKFEVPKPTTQMHRVTAKEALSDIPSNSLNNERMNTSPVVIERLKHIKPGENAWNSNLPAHLQLNVKGAKLSQIYRKLHPDFPSYTITGSGGGGTHGYHYEGNRPLTNRERARIQTFPDDYNFVGTMNSVRKQIGMAVPVKLSQIIFTAILNTFNGIQYPHIQANYTMDFEIKQPYLIAI